VPGLVPTPALLGADSETGGCRFESCQACSPLRGVSDIATENLRRLQRAAADQFCELRSTGLGRSSGGYWGRRERRFRHASAAEARRRFLKRSYAVSRAATLAVALSPSARIAAQGLRLTPAAAIIDSSPAQKVCFRGQVTCSSFFITEAGIGFRLNPDPLDPNPTGRLLTGELGWMRNQSQRWAWGATAFLGFGDKADGLGIRPRFRLWLSRTVSLDLAPGLVRHVHSGGGDWGFAGYGAVSIGDWLAVTGEALRVRTYTGQRGMAWYGGARLGSYPGVAACVGAGVVGILIALSCRGGACS